MVYFNLAYAFSYVAPCEWDKSKTLFRRRFDGQLAWGVLVVDASALCRGLVNGKSKLLALLNKLKLAARIKLRESWLEQHLVVEPYYSMSGDWLTGGRLILIF